MNCFLCSRSNSSSKTSSPEYSPPLNQENPETRKHKEEILLRIEGCSVYLIEEGEAVEISKGDFRLAILTDDNAFLATIIKIGEDLQWPLTKDEPVVKLDELHYLFSLPIKDGDLFSYGVSFSEKSKNDLGSLDLFLKENSCFSGLSSSQNQSRAIDWKEFAPRIEDYNGVLGKAIAGGTGMIVKGIFHCTNAYTKKVQEGGEMMLNPTTKEKNSLSATEFQNKKNGTNATKKSGLSKGLKRARKISKMTEKMSKSMLNGVGFVAGSVTAPLIKSKTGKALLASVPGEVLLASLDAFNKVFDAVEVAEKQALSATSNAATKMVSKRFGEDAGEATNDAFATAGHCAGTFWNIFKIRKAINPATSIRSGIVKNAIIRKK